MVLVQIPAAATFSLPHVDTFDSVANDTTPKYTSDMSGVFTAISVDDVPGKVLRQQTNSAPSCTHGGGGWFGTLIGKVPHGCNVIPRFPSVNWFVSNDQQRRLAFVWAWLGDGSWVDYEVELSARSELSGGTIFIGENLTLQHPTTSK